MGKTWHYLLKTRLSPPLYQTLACDRESRKTWHYLLEARLFLRQGNAKSRHVIAQSRLVACDSRNTPVVTFVPNRVMCLSKAKFWLEGAKSSTISPRILKRNTRWQVKGQRLALGG